MVLLYYYLHVLLSGLLESFQYFKLNEESRNFRIFGPDETMSNRLYKVFEAQKRDWNAEVHDADEDIGHNFCYVHNDQNRKEDSLHLVEDTYVLHLLFYWKYDQGSPDLDV